NLNQCTSRSVFTASIRAYRSKISLAPYPRVRLCTRAGVRSGCIGRELDAVRFSDSDRHAGLQPYGGILPAPKETSAGRETFSCARAVGLENLGTDKWFDWQSLRCLEPLPRR